MGTALTVIVVALGSGAAVAVGKAASGGTTSQTTSEYDFAGKGCGNDKDNVRGGNC